MKFKTMLYAYQLLCEDLEKEKRKEKKLKERVNLEKSKLESCWATSEELEYWSASWETCKVKIGELADMKVDMENYMV